MSKVAGKKKMEEFIKKMKDRVSFFFYQKNSHNLYEVKEGLEKVSESTLFPFLKKNFYLLKNLLSTEDLNILGEKTLFSHGIIYPGNVNRAISDFNKIEINNQNDLILFNIGEEVADIMVISGCSIECMADVSVESIIHDTIVSCVEGCENVHFSLCDIHVVKNSGVCIWEAPFSLVRDFSIKNNCRETINFIEGSSRVAISCGTIKIVSDYSEIEMSGGEIGVMKGKSRAVVKNGIIHTIAEKAIVLTTAELTMSVHGDALLVRFQEGPEPEKPPKFYDGWYKKQREIISARMGDCSLL